MRSHEGLGDISWPFEVFNSVSHLVLAAAPLTPPHLISLIQRAHPQLLQGAKGSDVDENFAKAPPLGSQGTREPFIPCWVWLQFRNITRRSFIMGFYLLG